MASFLDEITVLSVCYNSKDVITNCLAPLMGAKQVIVVDNASTDNSVDIIRGALPGVTIVQNETNKGYGGGVNAGLFKVETPYLLIVNPDSEVTVKDVRGLYDALIKYEGAAIVSPQLDVPRHGLENWVKGPAEHIHGKADFSPEGDFCSWFMPGTVNLCRAKLLQGIGGFDENIFLYQEDLDICHRITRAGHSIICVPSVIVRHLNNLSTGGVSPKQHWRKDWNFAWSTLYVLEKNLDRSTMLKQALRFLSVNFPKSLFYALVLDRKRFIRDGALTAGCIAYLVGHIPKRSRLTAPPTNPSGRAEIE
ncbi:MAG: glycosyltransferase family 2 protein [Rhodospirillales bacterium]|nr:glycosyltransferase family 2 protein [Rhodospirillales bacterium]